MIFKWFSIFLSLSILTNTLKILYVMVTQTVDKLLWFCLLYLVSGFGTHYYRRTNLRDGEQSHQHWLRAGSLRGEEIPTWCYGPRSHIWSVLSKSFSYHSPWSNLRLCWRQHCNLSINLVAKCSESMQTSVFFFYNRYINITYMFNWMCCHSSKKKEKKKYSFIWFENQIQFRFMY